MSKIDGYYRSAITYTQNPPTTETVSSSFNYTIADNLYGNSILLYTGLIPNPNPLTGAADGDKYTAPNGVDVVEKVAEQVLTQVEDSSFGFTDSRLTYLIPGAVYGITVWSKDSNGDYTVPVPPKFYDIFFYPPAGTYVVYFKEKYKPIYQSDVFDIPFYAPAITCYKYCGPVGIENIPVDSIHYPILTTYSDEFESLQVISDWDVPVVEGKKYNLEYTIYGESGNTNGSNMYIYYDTSSFTDPLKFSGIIMEDNSGLNGIASDAISGYTMLDFDGAVYIGNAGGSSKMIAGKMSITFDCQETGTLQHIFENPYGIIGTGPTSLLPGSLLKVTEVV